MRRSRSSRGSSRGGTTRNRRQAFLLYRICYARLASPLFRSGGLFLCVIISGLWCSMLSLCRLNKALPSVISGRWYYILRDISSRINKIELVKMVVNCRLGNIWLQLGRTL
jgi:hypothetical protein